MRKEKKENLSTLLLTATAIGTITLYVLLSVPGCPRSLSGRELDRYNFDKNNYLVKIEKSRRNELYKH